MTSAVNTYVYTGKSMWPYFQDNDLLLLEHVSFIDIRPGDCIGYHTSEGRVAVHRVVAKEEESLVTRGDAMQNIDRNKLLSHQVIGKITHRYRLNRRIRVWGGFRGRIAGAAYRYAGRIDPARHARGGVIARTIRVFCSRGLLFFRCHGKCHSMRMHDNSTTRVWMWGEIAVGRQDPQTSEWRIFWPWDLIIDKENCR